MVELFFTVLKLNMGYLKGVAGRISRIVVNEVLARVWGRCEYFVYVVE